MYQCLKVESRQSREQMKASTLRKDGWIPGVIFGKGIDSVNLQVKEKDLWKFLHHSGSVFEIEVAGKKHLCNLDDLQKDALGRKMMHVSFHKLEANQKTHVKVPIHFVGEAPGVKAGGVLNLMVDHIEVEGLPRDIPEFVEVDLSSIELNESYHLSSVAAPKGCHFTADLETNLVSCHAPRVVEESTDQVEPEMVGEAVPADDEVKEAS